MEYQDEPDTDFILREVKFKWESYKMCLIGNKKWYVPEEKHGQRAKGIEISVAVQYVVPSYLGRFSPNSIIT